MKKKNPNVPKRSEILNLVVNQLALKRLGYDMMGYIILEGDQLSFHHIIPTSSGGPDTAANCSPLSMNISHPYIHVVERYDIQLFRDISYELMRIKERGYVDIDGLLAIDQMLTYFEGRFDGQYNQKNNLIIRPEFKIRIQKYIR